MKGSFKKFFKAFFYCISFASLNLIMQVVATIPLVIIYMVFHGILSDNPTALLSPNIEKLTHDILLPASLSAGVLTFGAAWLLHLLFKRRFLERLSYRKTSFLFLLISFIAGCALQFPIGHILELVEGAGVGQELFEQYAELMEPLMTNQNLILQILAIGIMAPILEEILFRGLIFDQLKKNIPVWPALIIQALLFGLVHLNIIQGAYAFALGIIMGLTMLWSQSLLLPTAVHMGMNLTGVFLSQFHDHISDLTYNILLIVSYVLIPICILFLYYKTRVDKASAPPENQPESLTTL